MKLTLVQKVGNDRDRLAKKDTNVQSLEKSGSRDQHLMQKVGNDRLAKKDTKVQSPEKSGLRDSMVIVSQIQRA